MSLDLDSIQWFKKGGKAEGQKGGKANSFDIRAPAFSKKCRGEKFPLEISKGQKGEKAEGRKRRKGRRAEGQICFRVGVQYFEPLQG